MPYTHQQNSCVKLMNPLLLEHWRTIYLTVGVPDSFSLFAIFWAAYYVNLQLSRVLGIYSSFLHWHGCFPVYGHAITFRSRPILVLLKNHHVSEVTGTGSAKTVRHYILPCDYLGQLLQDHLPIHAIWKLWWNYIELIWKAKALDIIF